MRILLVRHAAFDGVGRLLAGRSAGVHLSDEGRRQAAALSDRIDEPVAAVTCSPRERAVETAQAIATPRGLACRVDAAFDEFDFGDWTGRDIDSLTDDPLWQDFNRLRGTVCAPGGECFSDLQARALAGIRAMKRQATDRPAETGVHVLVTHADVIRAILTAVLQMPAPAALHIDVDPASVTAITFHGHWPQVTLVNG